MSFEMKLWRVAGAKLQDVDASHLDQEQRLEDWIADAPSMVGMDLVIIGRQVQTSFGGRIDLLALNRDASCVVLELKRGRTPREAVAQILEYAAWIKDLGYNELDQITQDCRRATWPRFSRILSGRQFQIQSMLVTIWLLWPLSWTSRPNALSTTFQTSMESALMRCSLAFSATERASLWDAPG